MSETWQGGELIEWSAPSHDSAILYDPREGSFYGFRKFPRGTLATVLSSKIRTHSGREEASILIMLEGGEMWETYKLGWKKLL